MADTLLLTVDEAAAELRISRAQVYNLMADGHLPYVKIGRLRRLRRATIEAYIEHLAQQKQDEEARVLRLVGGFGGR